MPEPLPVAPNQRGFMYGAFTDEFGHVCSIQESSRATEPCIWLGINEGVLCRMHLTQPMVAALLPLLQHFVEYGTLRGESEE